MTKERIWGGWVDGELTCTGHGRFTVLIAPVAGDLLHATILEGSTAIDSFRLRWSQLGELTHHLSASPGGRGSRVVLAVDPDAALQGSLASPPPPPPPLPPGDATFVLDAVAQLGASVVDAALYMRNKTPRGNAA